MLVNVYRGSLLAEASLVAQMVKNLPAMQETQVQSLGWEDPLEEEITTHSRKASRKVSVLNELSPLIRVVKGTVFPAVRYGCESWTIKKAE